MNFKTFLLLLLSLWLTVGYAQEDILPAEHKKIKKGQLSSDYTSYYRREGFNIPAMRVPDKEIKAVKSPATNFLICAQNNLEYARLDYEKSKEIKRLHEIKNCIEQVKLLDWNWDYKALQLEYEFYRDYENERFQREVVAVRRADSLRLLSEQRRKDSLANIYILENRRADSLEQIRKKHLASRKDSIEKADRYAGYHFVNVKSAELRAAPSPDAPLIVNVRACTYVKRLTKPDRNGYVFVEVSDYQGYMLDGFLVDNLNKIGVAGADVRFARENYFVSIYVPAGSTYDPLRQQGEIPVAILPEELKKNPNALNELVAKLERENKRVKEPKPKPEKIKPVINNEPIAEVKTNPLPKAETKPDKEKEKPLIVLTEEDKHNSRKDKKDKGTGRRKQCTVLLPDGSQCPNVTTSNACRCYLHDQ